MAKTIEIEVTVPEGVQAGDTFKVEVELPKKKTGAVAGQRGQLAGIAVEDMTDEQLKREIINAGSVLYKAKQRGASDEVINANQARLDAAKAERAKRTPVATAAPSDAPVVEGALDGEVYNEETASEM